MHKPTNGFQHSATATYNCISCNRQIGLSGNDRRKHMIEHIIEDDLYTTPTVTDAAEEGGTTPNCRRPLYSYKCNLCDTLAGSISNTEEIKEHLRRHRNQISTLSICYNNFDFLDGSSPTPVVLSPATKCDKCLESIGGTLLDFLSHMDFHRVYPLLSSVVTTSTELTSDLGKILLSFSWQCLKFKLSTKSTDPNHSLVNMKADELWLEVKSAEQNLKGVILKCENLNKLQEQVGKSPVFPLLPEIREHCEGLLIDLANLKDQVANKLPGKFRYLDSICGGLD